MDINTHHFDIALSFPGQKRDFVRSMADCLVKKRGSDSVFYDDFYEGVLPSIDLDRFLNDIYFNRCKMVVACFCKEYSEKNWCGLEWRAIRARIKHDTNNQ